MKRIRKTTCAICIGAMLLLTSFDLLWAGDKIKFSENQICKAGIAAIMNCDPSIIKIDRKLKNVIYLSYMRQSDGSKWKNKCKLDGNRIVWGSADGRWRTHSMDSVLTFNSSNNSLTIEERFSDGSTILKTYTLKQLVD